MEQRIKTVAGSVQIQSITMRSNLCQTGCEGDLGRARNQCDMAHKSTKFCPRMALSPRVNNNIVGAGPSYV